MISMGTLEQTAAAIGQVLDWLRTQAATVRSWVTGLQDAGRQLGAVRRLLWTGKSTGEPAGDTAAYETRSLELVLDLIDARGKRAVLTRVQRVQVHAAEDVVIRELFWGDGEQLVHYVARGARRLQVRQEGSKRAILLAPEQRLAGEAALTIRSRRTLRDAFLEREEYCEAYLERPTGRLDITVLFPPARPPKRVVLVAGPRGEVLRTLRVRYDAGGRGRAHCRVRKPAVGTTYSLRWQW